MGNQTFKQEEITNILVIAWNANGVILKASAFHDEKAALDKSRDYIEDEDTVHVVRYYAKFKPDETALLPYGWFTLEQE